PLVALTSMLPNATVWLAGLALPITGAMPVPLSVTVGADAPFSSGSALVIVTSPAYEMRAAGENVTVTTCWPPAAIVQVLVHGGFSEYAAAPLPPIAIV